MVYETDSGRPPHPQTWPAALLRLWFLRAAGPLEERTALRTSLALGLASLALWVGIDWWQIQPDPHLSATATPLFAWYGLAVLGLAALLKRLARIQGAVPSVLTLVMGLVPMLVLFVASETMWGDPRWLAGSRALVAVYTLVYLLRGLRALCGQSRRVAALLGAVYVGAFLWASDALDVIPDVWSSAEAETAAADGTATPTDADGAGADAAGADADGAGADAEEILFRQAAQIDAALAPIRRAPGDAPEAFFLGFAGVGDEKVFAGEIGLAARVIDSRYGVAERHLELINDQRDLDQHPLATVSGLRYALQGLAARMRLDRDILFLSISSHGSSDGAVAVSNDGLPLDELTPADLVQALKDAGIQWRVIIVSACYAGAFVPALADPRTIVLTAAAADRTSFGCSNDRELTYFGEAFYRDALPKAQSLQAAFDAAKLAIGAREQREGFTPSNPQAYFGKAIAARLTAIAGGSGAAPRSAQVDTGAATAKDVTALTREQEREEEDPDQQRRVQQKISTGHRHQGGDDRQGQGDPEYDRPERAGPRCATERGGDFRPALEAGRAHEAKKRRDDQLKHEPAPGRGDVPGEHARAREQSAGSREQPPADQCQIAGEGRRDPDEKHEPDRTRRSAREPRAPRGETEGEREFDAARTVVLQEETRPGVQVAHERCAQQHRDPDQGCSRRDAPGGQSAPSAVANQAAIGYIPSWIKSRNSSGWSPSPKSVPWAPPRPTESAPDKFRARA
jgi:hypothetical protein